MASQISIDVIFNAINKTSNVMGQVNRGLNGMMNKMWKVNQAADLMGRMSDTIGRMSSPFAAYDESLAELSAITGIAGTNLESLGKTARKVGKSSGVGATGALEAYKLLASQIDVSKIGIKGLNELQSKTITLAQASGMSMADSANSLAGTINQFGLAADQAGRVMNVLAAGSKYGAAEIPELSQSFKVVGTAAAAAGLNVEQTGGALEALSKANLKGSESGTALRNILNSMQVKLGFDFKVTRLSDALKTLSEKQGDAAYMSKVFGQENIAAAQFLVKNADLVDEMTERMTGTSVATEQANIRNKTFNHRMSVMKARLNDLSIGFFKNNSGLLQWIQTGGHMAMMMTTMSPIVGFLGKGFVGTVTGISSTVKAARLMNKAFAAGKIGTYAKLMQRYGLAGKAAGIWIRISSAAQTVWNTIAGFTTATMTPLIAKTWAWTAALLANPITWIVVGVMALVGAILLAWKHFDWFRGGIVAAWESVKQFGKILFDSIISPIKLMLGGISKLIKAFQLLKKKDFSGAWAVTKDGFGDIGKGFFQATPIGVVKNVIDRRNEIANAATAGYAKGKAIDTSNFLYLSKKKDKPISGADMQKTVPGFSLPKIPGVMDLSMPDPGTIDVAGKINMGSPEAPKMDAVNMPGKIIKMTTPKPGAVEVPGQYNMGSPKMDAVNTPGKIIKMTTSQPSAIEVPGKIVDAAAPKIGTVKIPGVWDMNTPGFGLDGIPIRSEQPDYVMRPEPGRLEEVTRNITQNITRNESRSENLRSQQNSKIEVSYQPQINVSATMTKENRENLMEMLRADKEQLMKLIKEEFRKEGRLNYAG